MAGKSWDKSSFGRMSKGEVKLKNELGTLGNFTVSGFSELGAEGRNNSSRSKQVGYISFTL